MYPENPFEEICSLYYYDTQFRRGIECLMGASKEGEVVNDSLFKNDCLVLANELEDLISKNEFSVYFIVTQEAKKNNGRFSAMVRKSDVRVFDWACAIARLGSVNKF